MPKLLKRKKEDQQEKSLPCNFSEPSMNVMVAEQTTIEELRQRCARYLELLKSLQPSQENVMIRATNFTVGSVQQLIQDNPDSTFLRVYYGIEETGEHIMFMGAVTEGAMATASAEGTPEAGTDYVDTCCSCPPMGDCKNDELLES